MKYAIIVALLVSRACYADNSLDSECPQFSVYGAPVAKVTSGQFICKSNYAIHYSFKTKTAEYVVEHPTMASISGNAKRKDDFRVDPDIAKANQSQLADYSSAGSTYDRGHLVPAANSNESAEMMSETFFLSNMIPQLASNNRGIWRKLEALVREQVNASSSIYVVSGTVYQPGYVMIGTNKVGVPSSVFKVIIDAKNNQAIGFVIPNIAIPTADLMKYAVSVATVETITGINFMPNLPAKLKNIEKTTTGWINE